MARFERSKERKSKTDFKGSFQKRNTGSRMNFEDNPEVRERRYPDREFRPNRGNRREVQMTKVTCSSCGEECEVPFKPVSTKPVYCNDCFAKKDKGSFGKPSNKDFNIINEKLDKIMKALDIE